MSKGGAAESRKTENKQIRNSFLFIKLSNQNKANTARRRTYRSVLCCKLTGFLDQERGYSHGEKCISRRQRKRCIISTENRITESLVIDICSGKARRFLQASSLCWFFVPLRRREEVFGLLEDGGPFFSAESVLNDKSLKK